MQYFEQVHRGIRAPDRALAPAICAVALCTAALMMTAWPTTAEAEDYKVWISNTPETGKDVKIRRIGYKLRGEVGWKTIWKDLDNPKLLPNDDTDTSDSEQYWETTYSTKGSSNPENKARIVWKCVGKDWHTLHTTIWTYDNTTHFKMTGCTNDKVVKSTNDD